MARRLNEYHGGSVPIPPTIGPHLPPEFASPSVATPDPRSSPDDGAKSAKPGDHHVHINLAALTHRSPLTCKITFHIF